MIKVYATVEVKNNLITTIPFKGVKVRVEFTGGNSMKNIPAKLYTSDPFTQLALDSSDQKGRLYYVHQVIREEGDGNTGASARTSPATKSPDTVMPTATKSPDTVMPTATKSPDTVTPTAAMPPSTGQGTVTEPTSEPAVPDTDEDGDGSGAVGKLEFENLAEAVTYIATKYGEQVETEGQVRKFIEEKEGRKCLIHKG